MRRSPGFLVVATAALGLALLLPAAGRAQNMNWGADSWRAMQPGAGQCGTQSLSDRDAAAAEREDDNVVW